jgi:sec-independent protein translocase protein TatA
MFGFHAWDLLIVLLLVLLIFGARRLPELGSSLGQSYKMLQKGLNGSGGKEENEPATPAETPKESER